MQSDDNQEVFLSPIMQISPAINSIQDDSSFHLRKIKNVSSREVIFFRSVRAFGLETALWLASEFNWEFERPLKLLHEIGEVNSECYAAALSRLPLVSRTAPLSLPPEEVNLAKKENTGKSGFPPGENGMDH